MHESIVYIFQEICQRHNALSSKYGVSVRTHVVRGSASHQWLGMSCPNTLLLVEVKVIILFYMTIYIYLLLA